MLYIVQLNEAPSQICRDRGAALTRNSGMVSVRFCSKQQVCRLLPTFFNYQYQFEVNCNRLRPVMWRQSRLLDLRLWQTVCQGAEHTCEVLLNVQGARYGHSAGKRKVIQLEQQLSRLRGTTLEHLQEQVRQKVQKVAVVLAPQLGTGL